AFTKTACTDPTAICQFTFPNNTNGTVTVSFLAPAAPAITSADHTTFVVGTAGNFTVTTTGGPNPTLTKTGTLPSGVTFTNNGNGTATLSGTPGAGTGGTYPITITATNASGTATQNFALTVTKPQGTPSRIKQRSRGGPAGHLP